MAIMGKTEFEENLEILKLEFEFIVDAMRALANGVYVDGSHALVEKVIKDADDRISRLRSA